jgi:hypothetical protein
MFTSVLEFLDQQDSLVEQFSEERLRSDAIKIALLATFETLLNYHAVLEEQGRQYELPKGLDLKDLARIHRHARERRTSPAILAAALIDFVLIAEADLDWSVDGRPNSKQRQRYDGGTPVSIFRMTHEKNLPNILVTLNFIQSGSKSEAQHLIRLAEEIADEFGYEVTKRGPLTAGSWFQRVVFGLRDSLAEPEVNKRARAVEDLLFGHGNIDVDKKVVEMTASLVSALKGSSSGAVVDSGLFLFIKLPDGEGDFHIFAKRLTLEDRAILNEDPTIVQTPATTLSRLRDARKISAERILKLQTAIQYREAARGAGMVQGSLSPAVQPDEITAPADPTATE